MPISGFPTCIEVTLEFVTISFERLDGRTKCECAKPLQVEISCAELGSYNMSIGELVEKVNAERLLQFKWTIETGHASIAVSKDIFMRILPLDDWRKNGFCGMIHRFGDIVSAISDGIIGAPRAIYPVILYSCDWGESFRIEGDHCGHVSSMDIEPDVEVDVRSSGQGHDFIATVKDLLGVRPHTDLMRCNPHAIIDGVVVVEYAGNTMQIRNFLVRLDDADYNRVRNERKRRLNSMYGVSNTTNVFCHEPNATIFAYGLGVFYKLTYETPCGLRSRGYKHDDAVEIIDSDCCIRRRLVVFLDLLIGIPGITCIDSVYTKIADAEVKYEVQCCVSDPKVLGVSVYLSSGIFDSVIAAAKRRKKAEGYIDTDKVHEHLTFGSGKIYVGTSGAFGGLIGIVPEAIRRAIIENGEEKKMHNQFRMEIHSRCAGRYPWRSSNDETAVPKIKKVYFNKPVTVVLWEDGTKTVVKCQPGERYDAEKGLAMAISKKALGNTSKWYDTLKKELENAPKPKKRSSAKKKEDSNDEKA